ncbi:MAG: LysE family transporter [Saprospiraceae bacterium]|nr:LysE family transporter [Saprospiraceae bacterium]
MQALVEGIGWGIFLTFLIGPIFFALVQAGIEYGFRAGAMVGAGIWFSDILYIIFMYLSFQYLQELSETDGFIFWMGLAGGIILMSFGVGTFLSSPPKINYDQDLEVKKKNPYLSLFTKGVLVNAVNPFTVFFWLGMMSALSLKINWGSQEKIIFFSAIIGTIMCTDLLKVYLAKQIRKKLKASHLHWVRWITGGALFAFGIVLIWRCWTL